MTNIDAAALEIINTLAVIKALSVENEQASNEYRGGHDSEVSYSDPTYLSVIDARNERLRSSIRLAARSMMKAQYDLYDAVDSLRRGWSVQGEAVEKPQQVTRQELAEARAMQAKRLARSTPI